MPTFVIIKKEKKYNNKEKKKNARDIFSKKYF